MSYDGRLIETLLTKPTTTNQKNLAVLIDAENISPNHIGLVLDEIAKYGIANIRRIYGDWTTPQMNTWKKILHKLSIHPFQQFKYTIGKNSSDSAMIIDAMDILHDRDIDGFCIVSSDSDYTRLATRVRESGKIVYGFGYKQTPEAFRQACNMFTLIETLKEAQVEFEKFVEQMKEEKSRRDLISFLRKAVDDVADEDGWAYLNRVAPLIRNRRPDFDYREYEVSKLSSLFTKLEVFSVEQDEVHGPMVKYGRRKRRKK